MRFLYHDFYQNRQQRIKLDHLGGNVFGNINVIDNGDYLHNGNILLPVGTIIQYIANEAPGGWLICNGSEVKKSEYPRLYKIIGETFGTSINSNNFVLPDLRGRIPVGSGQGDGLTNRTIGDIGGSETHTLTIAEIPSHAHNATIDACGNHTHPITDPGHSHSINNQVQITGNNTPGSLDQTANEIDNINVITRNTITNTTGITINTSGSHIHDISINTTGDGQSHNNMQPFLVVNYIIRF